MTPPSTLGTVVNKLAEKIHPLHCLTKVLDYINVQGSVPKSPDEIVSLVEEQIAQVPHTIPPLPLNRGCATIPLRGIDVPFHSSRLLPGVAGFRRCLLDLIDSNSVDTKCLVGRYIPNLTAQPFEMSKGYFELVHKLTGSDSLEKIIAEVSSLFVPYAEYYLVANTWPVGSIHEAKWLRWTAET